MADYFPTDVRVRINGDTDAAKELVGPARSLLFRALLLQAQYGGNQPILLRHELSDTSGVQVLIVGQQKLVTLHAGAPLPPVEEVKPEIWPEERDESVIGLLNGWVRDGNFVAAGGDTPAQYDAFRPTAINERIYHWKSGFNNNWRLAGNTQALGLRPSQYSGAMKRVVQAIYGLGIIDDKTPSYISGDIPSPTKRLIEHGYDFDFYATNGVYKAGPKNHWLIEISQAKGVLAMPLIMFPWSMTSRYRNALRARGDTETLKVIDEFGGLPTGEWFPSGDALETAIAAGKVLRLLTTTQLEPFYSLVYYHSRDLGWAFSDTGKEAHQACVRFISSRYRTAVTMPYTAAVFTWDDDHDVPLPVAEHWKVTLNLSPHNIAALRRGEALGTGSAALTCVHRGCYDRSFGDYYVPRLGALDSWRPWTGMEMGGLPQDYAQAGISNDGGVVHVYFDGDRLIRVRSVTPKLISKDTRAWPAGCIFSGNFLSGYTGSIQYKYLSYADTGPITLRDNAGHMPLRYWYSPAAYVADNHDPRFVCQTTADLQYDTQMFEFHSSRENWTWLRFAGIATIAELDHQYDRANAAVMPPAWAWNYSRAGDIWLRQKMVVPVGMREAWVSLERINRWLCGWQLRTHGMRVAYPDGAGGWLNADATNDEAIARHATSTELYWGDYSDESGNYYGPYHRDFSGDFFAHWFGSAYHVNAPPNAGIAGSGSTVLRDVLLANGQRSTLPPSDYFLAADFDDNGAQQSYPSPGPHPYAVFSMYANAFNGERYACDAAVDFVSDTRPRRPPTLQGLPDGLAGKALDKFSWIGVVP